MRCELADGEWIIMKPMVGLIALQKPPVARMVAASVFSALLVRRSLTLECSTTSRVGSGGRPS